MFFQADQVLYLFSKLIQHHLIFNFWFYWIKIYNYFCDSSRKHSFGSHYSALKSTHNLRRYFGLGHWTFLKRTICFLLLYDHQKEMLHDRCTINSIRGWGAKPQIMWKLICITITKRPKSRLTTLSRQKVLLVLVWGGVVMRPCTAYVLICCDSQ